MALKISSGPLGGALKVVIYGPEGIGKSTLAARFPRPLFIDTEGSTRHMDVARTEKPSSWTMLLEQVKAVRDDPSLCSTLVIDTADWAEMLCVSHICAENKVSGLESFGYGKGYVYLAEEFGRLLNLLSEVIAQGMTVVVTAHAMMRKFEQPDEMGAYDRWELKLQRKTAPLLKEWADMVLFANYRTMVIATDKEGKKHKAQGGRRVLYTTHHPCWDAKNRMGLPEEIPMDFSALAPYIGDAAAVPAAPAESPQVAPVPSSLTATPAPGSAAVSVPAVPGPSRKDDLEVPQVLVPLLESAHVTEEEVREVIAHRQGVFPMGTTWRVMEESGFVEGWVLPFWDKIVEMIESDPHRLPF